MGRKMRLFLLILIVIVLASCGRRNRNRNRKPDQGKPEKDHEKESTIENNDEKQEKKDKVEETCKTGLNDNCVMMYFGRSGRHPWDDSMKVYRCSDKYNCEKFEKMMDQLSDDKKPAEFYCKTCNPLKYDKCNGDL